MQHKCQNVMCVRFTPSSHLMMCDTRHMSEPTSPPPPPPSTTTPCHNGQPPAIMGRSLIFFVPQQALLQLVDQYLFVSALLWVMLFLPEPRLQEAFEFNHKLWFNISSMKNHSTCLCNMQLSTDKNCTPEFWDYSI